MKVSLLQMNSVSDKAANIAAALELGEGPAYRAMQAFAGRHKVVVHAGSILEKIADDERLYNTTVVFGPRGQELARYRKIHMFDITTPDGTSYKESASFKSGDAIVTYEASGVTFGCAICYDLRFPALFEALVAKGAQAIVLPAAFTLQTGKDHWEVLCRARAIETQTYFLAPGQTGDHTTPAGARQTYGHSLIVDPWGHVIGRASDGPGVVSARIDPARVAKVRELIPVASHKVALSA